MELAVIAADVQEVVGTGIAFNLLSGGWIPIWAGCLITVVDTFTFLAVGYLGIRYLEALIGALIGVIAVCFFANWAATGLGDHDELLRGWAVPKLPTHGFTQVCDARGRGLHPPHARSCG